MTPYALILLVLGLFGAFHEASAREGVRAAALSRLAISPAAFAGLRALCSFALLLLSVVLLFRLAPRTALLFEPLTGIGALVPALFAFWIAGLALRQVARAGRIPQFFGFRNAPKIFIYSGAFTLCRHPMYTGWLVASWGLLLSKPYLLTLFYNALLTAYVVFMAREEERRMTALFGEKYRAYQRQIPFLLPYGFLKPRIRREGAPRF
jgi:protein-S-isoprenylcysteine O-methyltransferase Ste14